MKKFDITVSLGIIILCVLLMILLGLRSRDGDGTAPSYRFLGGRNPITCKDVKTGGMDKCYYYSFEGDFNDICLKADAELIGAGFVVRPNVGKTLSGKEYSIRDYLQKNRFPRGAVWIVIENNRKYIEHRISKEGVLDNIDGWIVITIVYWRNWWWPF